MFKAHCITIRDPFHPARHREVKELTGPAPIAALAPETDSPFIILRNGQAVLRADWNQPVKDGDLMAVVLLPQGGGGGGSNPLRIVLSIAVIIAAGAAFDFVTSVEGLGMSKMAGYAASAAVGILGTALVNALVPPPKPPTSGQMGNDWKAASPTYNIAAQGNQARLDAAIPIQYGRVQVYPDFAASPYTEYAGNEQYLYQLFCLGEGDFSVESVRIEDTAIDNFEEVQYEVVPPFQSVSLFPSAVSTAVEVSGQEALYNDPIGPFIVNPAGTQATRIAVDVVCPRGLYFANDSGSLDARSVAIRIEARAVDVDGTPIGSWITLGDRTVTAATTTPQRYSFSFGVSTGRYEVKLTRTNTKDTSSRAGNEIQWAGLRAYLVDESDFGNVTLLAVKMRATNNLSQQASRKINVICTRKLYYWTGAAWAGPVATRSIAWALADACLHVGIPDSQIDIDGLIALDATWAARGDRFDGRFDSTTTFWDALTRIARAGRAKPYMQGGVLYFMRDEPVALPKALYSMRNILRNSFSLDFITPSTDTADSVEVSYFDAVTWKPRRMICKLPGSTAQKPAKVELFGVTGREHAYREGLYMAAANRYRRTLIKFSTEMEGFIPSYGDLVAINHDLPQWGQHAEVVAWDGDTLTATLSEPMKWDTGTHYIGLRRRDGSLAGPFVVEPGESPYEVVFVEAPEITPYTGQMEERTHITFGWGETWRQLARVLTIRPLDEYTVELTCINEDPSVHTAEVGAIAPPIISSQLPATPSAPVLTGLSARSQVDNVNLMLVSWNPAPGADYYIVEQSADGESWTRVGESRASNYMGLALYGAQTIVRVAAVGALRGAWTQVYFAQYGDYMWSGDANLMWDADDSTLMWKY